MIFTTGNEADWGGFFRTSLGAEEELIFGGLIVFKSDKKGNSEQKYANDKCK